MTTPPTRDWLAPRAAALQHLPRPATERWQPLRLGLVDLFYYDDEQFWFHDGRLLLRGNNGTGKSKVLALTLPFLLDGSLHPRRVEPDADPKKRMEWNLLLGGAHPQPERTGYAWAEFGRVDAEGTEHFTTLAIGLKAAAGRGIVKHWYAVTSRRVGDLRLVDDHRVVLTQERLRDELAAGDGQVLTTQEAYRRAVDEALFRLGEERYAALVDLLVQLRQPQLSKKPDEKALSAALTEALTPLDQAVVADVAESFRSLEEERAGIAAARETHGAAAAFLQHYRGYARVASRRHTTAVREANSAFERAGRSLREAEIAREEATAESGRLHDEHRAATEHLGGLQGQETVLRQSPEMRSAQQLDQAGVDAREMGERSDAAEDEAALARAAAEREAAAAAADARRWQDASSEEQQQSVAAERAAGPAGLAEEHPALAADERAAGRAVDRRREQVRHLGRLVEESTRAAEQAERRRSALDEAESRAAARAEAVVAAETAVETAVAQHVSAVGAHLHGLEVLVVDDRDAVTERAETWARSQVGESPARAAVEGALAVLLESVAAEVAAARLVEQRIRTEAAEVDVELDALRSGSDPEPPPVPGREPRAVDVPGAPLWRVTDFAENVPAEQRSGLEAALQSAGLLDAWLFADGTLETAGDVVLAPVGESVERSLAAVLLPAAGPDQVVPVDAVGAVLSRIGLGESSGAELWVDAEGRWGAGPARGSWAKPRAEYVGAGAREASRRERIAVLEARATDLARELAATHEQVARATGTRDRGRAESAAHPMTSERAIVTAHADVAAARRELEAAGTAVARARTSRDDAVRVADESAAELADQATSMALPTTTTGLEEVGSALGAYAHALTVLRAAVRRRVESEATRDQAAERAAAAAAVRERREQEAGELRTRALGLRARFEELQASVGASVADLQSRLAAVAESLREITATISRLSADQLAAAGRLGTLEQRVVDLTGRREEAATVRDARVEELRGFVATGLLRVALPGLDAPADDDGRDTPADADQDLPDAWHLTSALALARRAEQQLEGVEESEDAWSRVQQRVSTAATELQAQMTRHGHTAYVEQRGDVMVARVRHRGDDVDIDRLADRLATDVADRERLLSEREREILENHLVNEVAGHLHELLLAAAGQIDRMNDELAQRRTSTGMQLRVRWRERSDGPAGLATARALMLRSDATWTAADRTAIGDFLQSRIGEVRQADPTGGWQEHLEQALDYRQWHSFVVERLQNNQWRSASGPASGGEKVLAVSVPLFAAASAHYNSADDLAPRLILLDEAFAGVDDDSRAKSLGLLATFDLDVVMTSEREWGCYPQVPGLAIAQLSRVEGIDAVGVTRWRWDGRRRERLDDVDESARASGPAPTAPAEAATDSLFG